MEKLQEEVACLINRQKKISLLTLFTFLFTLLVIGFGCCTIGRYQVPVRNVVLSLSNYIMGSKFDIAGKEYSSVILIRLPRTLMAILVGSSLSLAGSVYQSVFNNKLVSPDLLGVTGGSCVGAALAILFGASGMIVMMSSFVFGLIAVCIALFLPVLMRNGSNLSLVLAGIIVSAVFNSCLGLIKYTVDSLEKLEAITFWIMGSLASVTMRDVALAFPFFMISTVVLLLLRFRINIISLGKTEANLLGVRFQTTRIIVIACATVLTACSTAICGTVSWIGLIVPHIARLIVDSDNRNLIPMSAMLGAVILPIIDTLCRTLTISEIPISIVSAALGAVIFYVILLQKGRLLNDNI